MVAPRRLAVVLATAALAACAGTSEPPTDESARDPAPSTERFTERIPAAWPHPLRAPAARSTDGMVATDAPRATAVGVDVLEAGGNAVDAAVAVAFTLAVVYPEAGNLGGGGFLVLHTAEGESAALDFRERAPLASTPDMFLDAEGHLTDRSLTGHLASGVPGSVAGLWEAHRRFGSRPWAELVAPAIRLAEEGFTVNDRFAATIAGERDRLARFDASAALFLPNGRPPKVGDRWRNPDLAATLRRIAAHGRDGFYRGETARRIAAEMRRGGGLITREDLARYEAVWRPPVAFDYRGHRVLSMPPPSSGGLTLGLMANILEGYDLAGLGWHSAGALHRTAEAMRRAFADRNHYLGDPDFVDIPRGQFLSERYAARQRATIGAVRATPSDSVGPGLGGDAAGGAHTTHVSVVDSDGNAAALTTTVNFLYGSAVTVEGAGFVLNNEMDDFTAKPGEPNAYGLVQGEANAVEPGKRPLSAMTPTIVLAPADGSGGTAAAAPLLVTGARGGPRIITAVLQVLSNVVDYGMALPAAVHAPRVHHQHLPDRLDYERGGLTEGVVNDLLRRGHAVRARGPIGNAPSILRLDGAWTGGADPRQGGRARGPE